jgi:predicted aspartyl protease
MPKTFAFAIFIAIAGLAPKAGAAAAIEIAVRIDDAGAVIVPVRINGNGPFPFLLDTGSTHSVISRALVERLAMRFVAKTSVLTSTGREWRPVVEIDQTEIEGARSERLLASVAPSSPLNDIAHGIEGIIGQDFLFGLNYTLDYRRKRLAWHDGDPAGESTRLPLVAQGGRYLVRVASADGRAPLLLVPDSGASGFVAYERNGRTKLALRPASGTMTVDSLSGGNSVRTMLLRELRLGALTMSEHRVAVVPREAHDVVEGDGLLPLHLFASVSFNAREQCLVIRR